MFDRLISLITELWDQLNPLFIINEYEEGVLLRFGIYKRNLGKGIHWKVPFIDTVLSIHTVWTTINLPPQSLITKDEKNIVVTAVVKYRVSDIKKFQLEVYDSIDAISDLSQGAIKKIVMSKMWEDCKNDDLDNDITKKARVEVKKFGIEIDQITLTNLAQIRSIRLFNDTTNVS